MAKTISRFERAVVLAFVAVLAAALALVVLNPAAPQSAYAGQVLKASAETDLAADDGDLATVPTVRVRANVQSRGWLATVKAGKCAGTKSKKPLRAFKVKLADKGKLTGHVKYKTYDAGAGWGATRKDGASSGRVSRAVRGAKIWLTGAISKKYDVWYRVYIKGNGWQPWVRNGAVAGTTKGSAYASALSVKIAPHSDYAVDPTKENLDGIDIASWQAGINLKKVEADFVIVKATEGTWYVNPYFKKWADTAIANGKLLGSYHFVRTGNAVKQADYFVKTVGPYVGKCALFLDWEDRDGDSSTRQGVAWAKKFLDRVYKKTGVKPLIYMSKSVTRESNWKKVAKAYGLWVAQYLYKYYDKGSRYVSDPDTDEYGFGAWEAPTIYQYNSRGKVSGYSGYLDINVFYGRLADWKKMAAKA